MACCQFPSLREIKFEGIFGERKMFLPAACGMVFRRVEFFFFFFFLGHLGLFQFWKPFTWKTSAFKLQKCSNFPTFKKFEIFEKISIFKLFHILKVLNFHNYKKINFFCFYWIFLFFFLFLQVYFRPRNNLAAAGSL